MSSRKYFLALSVIGAGLYQPALAAGTEYYKAHDFESVGNIIDGAQPAGLMAYAGGILYGTTESGGAYGAGTVFMFNPATAQETLLYTFKGGKDGSTPARDVVFSNGKLYGTTTFGGNPPSAQANETGTIFSIDVTTGQKLTLYKFPNSGALGYAPGDVTLVNGVLYGLTAGSIDSHGKTFFGTIFSFDLTSGVFHNLHTFQQDTGDGGFPRAGLVYENGVLYGTTRQGGIGSGSLFSYTIGTATYSILYAFGATHGYPTLLSSTPIYLDGALYFTSAAGGLSAQDYYGYGTVTKFDLTSEQVTVLYSFQSAADGMTPLSGLVYSNGLLYGTTSLGGSNGGGVIFSVDPTTGAEANLYSFGRKNDGYEPVAAMTLVGGTLYGTTAFGGNQRTGTIFRYTPEQVP